MELNDAIAKHASGLTVPIILRDAAGREMEFQAPNNVNTINIALGPIGCFVFERTTELHPSLRTVYVQQTSNRPSDKSVILADPNTPSHN